MGSGAEKDNDLTNTSSSQIAVAGKKADRGVGLEWGGGWKKEVASKKKEKKSSCMGKRHSQCTVRRVQLDTQRQVYKEAGWQCRSECAVAGWSGKSHWGVVRVHEVTAPVEKNSHGSIHGLAASEKNAPGRESANRIDKQNKTEKR